MSKQKIIELIEDDEVLEDIKLIDEELDRQERESTGDNK